MTWHLARYVDQVAAAGKREWDLPMYVNAALGDAFTDEQRQRRPLGRAQLERAARVARGRAAHRCFRARHLQPRSGGGGQFLERYAAPGPLFVPETRQRARLRALHLAGARPRARCSRRSGSTAPATPTTRSARSSSTRRRSRPSPRRSACSARPRATGRGSPATTRPGAPPRRADGADRETTLGRWKVTAQFARWAVRRGRLDLDRARRRIRSRTRRSAARWSRSSARTASSSPARRPHAPRARRRATPASRRRSSRAEEGTFDNGAWVMRRRWNGDQIDYGLQLRRRAGLAQGSRWGPTMRTADWLCAALFVCTVPRRRARRVAAYRTGMVVTTGARPEALRGSTLCRRDVPRDRSPTRELTAGEPDGRRRSRRAGRSRSATRRAA